MSSTSVSSSSVSHAGHLPIFTIYGLLYELFRHLLRVLGIFSGNSKYVLFMDLELRIKLWIMWLAIGLNAHFSGIFQHVCNKLMRKAIYLRALIILKINRMIPANAESTQKPYTSKPENILSLKKGFHVDGKKGFISV